MTDGYDPDPDNPGFRRDGYAIATADAVPVDEIPVPGDTFIEIRDGVPYIGTEAGKPRNQPLNPDGPEGDHDYLASGEEYEDVTAKFNPAEGRDEHGRWTLGGLISKVESLDVRQRVGHQGVDIDRTAGKGYRVRLKSGEVQHYDQPGDAAKAAHQGKHFASPQARVKPDPARRLSGTSPMGKSGADLASPLEKFFAKEHRDQGTVAKGFTVYDRRSANTAKNLELYRDVPQEMRQHLAAKGTEIYIGTRPVTGMDDLHPLASKQPSGYSKDQTFAKVAAMVTMQHRHSPGAQEPGKPKDYKRVTVMAVGGGPKTYGSGSVNVSAHEAGHALDFTSGHYSQTAEFKALHEGVKKQFAIHPYYVQKSDPPQGRAEFFAEAFASWAVNRDDKNQRAGLIMRAVGASVGSHRQFLEGGSVGISRDAAQAELLRQGQAIAAYFDKFYQDFIKGQV